MYIDEHIISNSAEIFGDSSKRQTTPRDHYALRKVVFSELVNACGHIKSVITQNHRRQFHYCNLTPMERHTNGHALIEIQLQLRRREPRPIS